MYKYIYIYIYLRLRGCASVSIYAVWIALVRLGDALCCQPAFRALIGALRSPGKVREQQRDVFPLPLFLIDLVTTELDLDASGGRLACRYADAVVVALNHLRGVLSVELGLRGVTAAQREVHLVLLQTLADLHKRLLDGLDQRAAAAVWPSFERGGADPQHSMKALLVDFPSCAGTCRPREHISGPLKGIISSVDAVSQRRRRA